MTTKTLTAATSVLALAMTFAATAGFANSECTDGCEPPPPPPECISNCEPVKGNNGWGNGLDGTNPGTDKGNAQQVSTKQNTDPAEYDLDKVARFGGR